MRPISAEAREARTWTSVDQLSVRHAAQVWGLMVPCGLEPRTLRLLAVRSNQLSYENRCVCHCGMLAVFIVHVFRALGSAIAIAAVRARNLHDTLVPQRALWPKPSE